MDDVDYHHRVHEVLHNLSSTNDRASEDIDGFAAVKKSFLCRYSGIHVECDFLKRWTTS